MSEHPIVPCAACGALNRVPSERFDDVPLCAECHERLLDSAPRDVGARVFERLIGRSDIPVVVDCWAEWCGPCRVMAPQFAAAARQLRGRAIFVKLDTEAEPGIAGQLDIRSIPTMVAFRRGREIARTTGALQAPQIVEWVERIS